MLLLLLVGGLIGTACVVVYFLSSSTVPHPVYVYKPWGHEIIFAQYRSWLNWQGYVGKVLIIREGGELSLQYHRWKVETVYVYSGSMTMELWEDGKPNRYVMKAGDVQHIPRRMRHRMSAISDCVVVEASTNWLGDVVRLRDLYGRV